MFVKICVIIFIILAVGLFYRKTITRLYEGYQQTQISKERAKYYLLQDDVQIQNITQKLISDQTIPIDLKKLLVDGERNIIIFKYNSGSEQVAGYFSYLTKGAHPVMVFLRGGNGFFGIMRPNNKFSFLKHYNVVGTLYRGNIYGGEDEFGGADIHDVENLLKFFPQLEKFSQTKMPAPYSMMGVSRGAMEMFISLSESEYVKDRVNYAISVSGNIDLNVSIANRPEMKYLFKRLFKNSETSSFDQWVKSRNPIDHVKYLTKSLKVLLIYGLDDNRVSIEEQQNFKRALNEQGIKSQLVTIAGANHGLDNHFHELEEILTKFMH